ncbi:MAG: heparinase II/III family protein [Myxococcota bacterium]
MRRSAPARVLRTLRHLKSTQILAQLRHWIGGEVVPVRVAGETPRLRTDDTPVPFLGAPAHARYDGGRHFELIGHSVRFPTRIDWDYDEAGPLWAYHLHQFDYARAPSLGAQARTDLLLDWIERHPRGTGWNAHSTSLRILSWGKLLLTPGALSLDAEGQRRVCDSLASQLSTLARHLELRLQANHLFSNRLALLFGGHLFDGKEAQRWLERGLGLGRELDAQILTDGAHVERSPMYHALLLENLLDLINLSRAAPRPAAAAVLERAESCAEGMLGALDLWTQPDGDIALFADAGLGVAQTPEALAAYASKLDLRARAPARPGLLDAAGYVRLEAGPYTLIASVAGPMPSYQPGHAHCDALSFELSIGKQRVVTDTGVCEYSPGPRRDLARATRSHSTVEVQGLDQAEIWGAHRVGGRPLVALESADPPRSAEARCAGWATPDTLHRRHFSVDAGGVQIRDSLEGRPRPVRFSLPLAPGLEPAFETQTRLKIALPTESATWLKIELPRGDDLHWRIERRPYFPTFGEERDRACVVGEARNFRSGVWRLEVVTR